MAGDISHSDALTKSKDDGSSLPGPWAKTYAAKNKEELLQAYAEWCETYDQDSIQTFGYIAPKRAAEELARWLNKESSSSINEAIAMKKESLRIADVGAGTGLVGQELYKLAGYTNLLALDYSPDMLKLAKQKGFYKEFLCVDLDEPPERLEEQTEGSLTRNSLDAAVSVGTFTPHHVGLQALESVIGWIKSGGILTLSLREDFVTDEANGFHDKLRELESDNKIRLLHTTEPELYTAKVSDNIYFRCWTYQIG